jgi:hypothetical protein
MMRAPCGRRAFALRHIYGSVAQLVEQYPFKVLVLGSSPSRPTNHSMRPPGLLPRPGSLSIRHSADALIQRRRVPSRLRSLPRDSTLWSVALI